jgi:hypothetical protein
MKNTTITADALAKLTGLTDRRHRQLAKAGFFPPPVRGCYLQAETLTGLFKYFREMASQDPVAESRARLNSVRATSLERKAQLSEGALIDIVWAAQCVDESFGDFTACLAGRVPHLANLLTLCARQDKADDGLAQVTTRLIEDNRGISQTMQSGKSRMLQRLRQGPPEACGKSAWAELEDRLKGLAGKLTPTVGAEVAAALATSAAKPHGKK